MAKDYWALVTRNGLIETVSPTKGELERQAFKGTTIKRVPTGMVREILLQALKGKNSRVLHEATLGDVLQLF